MKSYKGLESYKLAESGWVGTILHMMSPTNTIFRADVRPSFRLNDPPHHPWVAAAPDGNVVAAHCDCKAGYVKK